MIIFSILEYRESDLIKIKLWGIRVLEGRGKIWGDQDMEKNGRKMLKKKFKDSKGFRKISNLVLKK